MCCHQNGSLVRTCYLQRRSMWSLFVSLLEQTSSMKQSSGHLPWEHHPRIEQETEQNM